MLEEIALSISTAIFFMCAFLVNGLMPQTPSDTAAPCEIVEVADNFTVIGTWSTGNRTLEFTKSGKLICNGQVIDYKEDSCSVTVDTALDGFKSEKATGGTKKGYTMKLELLGDDSIKLGGVTLSRAEQP
ncbi:MAG: hypothetical protein IJY93_06610 [Clostridia bacterium]|nr:hypothetical protein [Clostridia bacterium]